MNEPYDPKDDRAQMRFDGRMSYGDYLSLDQVLSAQNPISTAHDELLFIIQHQTSELWMKLCLHELQVARKQISEDSLPQAFKGLARVTRIFEQLNSAWDVLRTMTPSDYTKFRDTLGQSSGFQSHQYRLIEFALGNRNRAMMRPHAHKAALNEALEAELAKPSLYDEAILLAIRQGHMVTAPSPKDTPTAPSEEYRQLWKRVYSDIEAHWTLYELAEKLVDLEDYFRRWRFNHLTTVERVIGLKRGTGGTSGTQYLRKMLEVELFPDLWQVRTEL